MARGCAGQRSSIPFSVVFGLLCCFDFAEKSLDLKYWYDCCMTYSVSSTRALQLKSIAKDNRGRRKVKEHNGQVHQKEFLIAVELLLLWAARVSTS